MPARIYRPTETEVDDACATLLARTPGESKRYIKAAALVASGSIDHSDTEGWTVASQSKAGSKAQVRYSLKPGACTCYDFIHHGGVSCKHLDALAIYMRVIAAKMDASLRSPAAIEATATATGWRMMAELGPDDAIAAAEYVAAQPVDRRLEVLPGNASNRRNVYDRATHTGICMAQQQPGGAWRPCNPVDTVAWVRWLGAQQPVEVEAEVQPAATAHYAGGTLQRILSECPPDVAGVTLKARVIYGSQRTYTLTGYIYTGATWVKLPEDERQDFNEGAFNAVLEATGWIQPGRPVKADGLNYRYELTRGTAAQEHYGLRAGTEEWRREQRLTNLFAAQVAQNAADAAMVDQLDRAAQR